MPYIKPERRTTLLVGSTGPATPGELNYLITLLCKEYMEQQPDPSYTRCNEIVGVLECAKLEFYRRIVAEYEDDKIEENGDVY